MCKPNLSSKRWFLGTSAAPTLIAAKGEDKSGRRGLRHQPYREVRLGAALRRTRGEHIGAPRLGPVGDHHDESLADPHFRSRHRLFHHRRCLLLHHAPSDSVAQQKETSCSGSAVGHFPGSVSLAGTLCSAGYHLGARKAAKRLLDRVRAFLCWSGSFHCGRSFEAHRRRTVVSIEQKEAVIDSSFCAELWILAANDGPSRIDGILASVSTNWC
jgi:hypothetical protein